MLAVFRQALVSHADLLPFEPESGDIAGRDDTAVLKPGLNHPLPLFSDSRRPALHWRGAFRPTAARFHHADGEFGSVSESDRGLRLFDRMNQPESRVLRLQTSVRYPHPPNSRHSKLHAVG